MERSSLTVFEQALFNGLITYKKSQAYSFHEVGDLDRFLEPNGSLIHRFGNNLSTLQDKQWLKIKEDLQKEPFLKRRTAFRAIKTVCRNFLGYYYDEHNGKIAVEQTVAKSLVKNTPELSPISSFRRWYTNKMVIQAAGAAAVEIAAFETLSRLPQAPFFLPIFLNAGLKMRSDVPLMIELIYHPENLFPQNLS